MRADVRVRATDSSTVEGTEEVEHEDSRAGSICRNAASFHSAARLGFQVLASTHISDSLTSLE